MASGHRHFFRRATGMATCPMAVLAFPYPQVVTSIKPAVANLLPLQLSSLVGSLSIYL